ncbi:PepSY domain-containing protein [uncultured Kiloniella sp.]|mgnify:CR=1 FL=1|uniref:PepSY domain-containing protein n=1 Tax=Kiloniella sp. TaxID=1938587 RepID=UPI002607053B|nr:PepSY domain-containing protein [uncultured Kiloniella sp.]
MKQLKQTILFSSIGIFTLAGVAFAHSLDGTYVGKSKTEITDLLQTQGYEVREIEVEDEYLEAYALKDGIRYEIYVDPNTGNIVKVKEDD